MKTVTAIIGSGRKQRGLTYNATRQFLDELEATGDVKGEIVFLSEHELGLCRGCKACFSRGEERCPLKGDRDELIARMMASDGVVFATPNYTFQVSSTMKALLDRLGYVCHRPCFHGKVSTSIVAQGLFGGSKIVRYLDLVGGCLGFDVVKGSCVTALEPATEKDRRRMSSTLKKHSRRFHEQLLRPAFGPPSLFQLMGFRMARSSIRENLGEESRDFTYFRERGWFDSDYYYPTTLGPFKKAAGRLFDWLFTRIYRRPEPAEPASRPSRSGAGAR